MQVSDSVSLPGGDPAGDESLGAGPGGVSGADDDNDDTVRSFVVPAGVAGRLDKILAQLLPEHSRSRLQGWIEDGHVAIDGETAASVRHRVVAGDQITVQEQVAPEQLAFTPEPVEFPVVDEAQEWIVIDKPAGLVVHPGAGNWHGTLLNGLLYRYPELRAVARAGIVHRLDKDTSGLLVVARTETAQTALVRQLQARSVGREYVALVQGWLEHAGTAERPIGRDARVPVRMSADRPIAPKPAITHYAPVRHGMLGQTRITEVVCRLETGRTHQIRVHMAALGYPLLGDVLYGGRLIEPVRRQMLHARALRFDAPQSGASCAFTADPPADMLMAMAAVDWTVAH